MIFPLIFGLMSRPMRVRANSAGVGPACVDGVTLCTLNCPNDTAARAWANLTDEGLYSPCCPTGMDKVAPPQHSNDYEVTASVDAYIPSELVSVSIDVTRKDA